MSVCMCASVSERRLGVPIGLMMSVDLRPTFARLGGVEPDNSGPYPVDGVDMWDALIEGSVSPRNEIVYQVWHSPYCNKTCDPQNIANNGVSHVRALVQYCCIASCRVHAPLCQLAGCYMHAKRVYRVFLQCLHPV